MNHKIFYQTDTNKEGKLFSLFDISKKTPYSPEYLIEMAQLGKLKSFKIDEDWYSSMEWVDIFVCNLKKEIEKEIPEIKENKWTNYLSVSRKKIKWFDYFLTAIVSLFIYVWLIIFFSVIFRVISISGYYNIGFHFIKTTQQIYSWPARLIIGENYLVSDEIITKRWHNFIGSGYDKSGQVAGQLEGF